MSLDCGQTFTYRLKIFEISIKLVHQTRVILKTFNLLDAHQPANSITTDTNAKVVIFS